MRKRRWGFESYRFCTVFVSYSLRCVRLTQTFRIPHKSRLCDFFFSLNFHYVKILRKRRDSNPRSPLRDTVFPGLPIKPLSHFSLFQIPQNLPYGRLVDCEHYNKHIHILKRTSGCYHTKN